MELARIFTQEREWLHDSTGVDTRELKGKREAKDHMEKNRREREEQSRI